MAEALAREVDYETKLDTARRWTREWRFRIGVHHLRGLIDAPRAGAQYTDLARAVLAVLWPLVTDQFAIRYGPPPGRGGVVLGMGSLGAGRLNAMSDLDIIVIYDPAGVEASEGPRPLAARVYYARLTQAMITAMTSPMSQGKLYEVDMRLRPSGNQGPVATSLGAFQSYQRDQAWTWEHLALTRAAVIAGPEDLAADVEMFRTELLAEKGTLAAVAHEVAQMRARINAAKAPDSLWDAKIGPGRMQEIELMAQAGALLQGVPDRDVAAGLAAAVDAGLLDAAGAKQLSETYELCWRLQVAARLLSAQTLRLEALGQAGRAYLQRALGVKSLERGAELLQDQYDAADAVIGTTLNRHSAGQSGRDAG